MNPMADDCDEIPEDWTDISQKEVESVMNAAETDQGVQRRRMFVTP